MKKVIDEKFAAIVDAICYWLGYQSKIGRSQLIHEASLRYPIADAITAKGIAIHRVVLEQLHPIFKSKKIDLVIYDDSVIDVELEKDDKNLKEVYEFKLAKKQTNDKYGDEHQRVFDDIVRLAYYNLWTKKACFFLMCGNYDDFKTYFVGQSSKTPITTDGKVLTSQTPISLQQSDANTWNSGGLYKEWFDFVPNGEKNPEFEIISGDTNNWGLKTFQDNYKIRAERSNTFTDSIKVKTTCIAITAAGLQDRTHAAGIWKIEGVI
jgi:hypothetical protein